MSDDFVNHILDNLIGVEGKYSNNPLDKGGETMWGITIDTARAYGYTGEMKDLPRDKAFEIYKKNFYYLPGFDKVALMSQLLAEELFDSGVNFGPPVAVMWLQRWLNVYNRRRADYKDLTFTPTVDLHTIGALREYLNKRGSEGEMVLLTSLNCSQGHRYLELAEGREANEAFIYGWVRQRVFHQMREAIEENA